MESPLGLPPILTAHLLPTLEGLLMELLRSLTNAEWEVQTVAPKWTVKDVAAHLLDTQLRKLSIARDGYFGEPPAVSSPADLVAFINRLNAEGVAVYRRLSPAVLISLMEFASQASAAYHLSLDPFAQATFSVSWAGEEQSLNWFDTARELTERWHHQQQIRLAVNRPGAMTRELYHPVLDCFLRALPFHYRDVPAPEGSLLQMNISGECGGTWWLLRAMNGWKLVTQPTGDPHPVSTTTIPQDLAWRIFTKALDPASAEALVQVEGDRMYGSHILRLRAIVG
jgi:uncharacterized protein (TIGR03083 family)